MSEITKYEGENIPGIRSLEYCFVEDLLSESIDLKTLSVSLSFKDGKTWSGFYFTPGSLSPEIDKEVKTSAGTRWDQKIAVKVPRESKELSAQLSKLSEKRVLFRLTTHNGTRILMGTIQNPMKKSSGTKRTAGGFNGFEIVFAGKYSHPALYFPDVAQSGMEYPGGDPPE